MSSDYGLLSRVLHRVALSSPAILKATMQMEHGKWKGHDIDEASLAPVFICGLARSGSTLLLNRLVATGCFSTSSYRHMPFVLAPNMWSGLSASHQRRAVAQARAHDDGMTHGFDSEEAFEEVFWRAQYGAPKGPLLDWTRPGTKEVLRDFRRFMLSVVKAGTGARYLSKNNANTTRIPTLLRAAKTARVLVPFRDPLGFAGSTLRQHKRFLETHDTDRFARDYMSWLGHHEFGRDFRPFGAPGVVAPRDLERDVTRNYLVGYWTAVYREVLAKAPARVHFFDYDGFCQAPEQNLSEIGRFLGLAQSPTPPPEGIFGHRSYGGDDVDADVLREAQDLHAALKARGAPVT